MTQVTAGGDDQDIFEKALRALESEIATSGVFLSVDSATRQAYGQQIAAMARALRQEVNAGTMTWGEAAAQAQEARNAIMEILRARSTPVGRAVAEAMKGTGVRSTS